MKKTYILILFLVVALTSAIFALLAPSGQRPSPEPPSLTTPTPVSINPKPTLPVQYNKEGTDKLIDIVKNTRILSANDTSVKSRIVALAKQPSGSIFSTPQYIITYNSTFDVFEVIIYDQNLSSVKNAASRWFTDQGISKQGLCNLPVSFIIDPSLRQKISTFTDFNPLPDGC